MKRCRICHRQLRDAESVRIGIGPVCRSRLHRRKKASSPKKIQESENMTLWELLGGGEEENTEETNLPPAEYEKKPTGEPASP